MCQAIAGQSNTHRCVLLPSCQFLRMMLAKPGYDRWTKIRSLQGGVIFPASSHHSWKQQTLAANLMCGCCISFCLDSCWFAAFICSRSLQASSRSRKQHVTRLIHQPSCPKLAGPIVACDSTQTKIKQQRHASDLCGRILCLLFGPLSRNRLHLFKHF